MLFFWTRLLFCFSWSISLLFSCDEYLCTLRLCPFTGLSFKLTINLLSGVNDEPVSWNSRAVHKYSSHENSSEIDHEKQNKSHVQKKNSDGNSTEFEPSYLTHEMVSKPKTCSNIKRNYYSNVLQLKSKTCKAIFEIFWFMQIISFSTYFSPF